MAYNQYRDWQVGDYVCFYHSSSRRHGIITDRYLQYGEQVYDILSLACYLDYLIENKWRLDTSLYQTIFVTKHRRILSKLRKHTVVKYKLMGRGV